MPVDLNIRYFNQYCEILLYFCSYFQIYVTYVAMFF